jgi:hypothetical protein
VTQQRNVRGKAVSQSVNQAEAFEEEDDADTWDTRMPSSARRYQGLADVRTEVGHTPADVQTFGTARKSGMGYTGRQTAIPPRRSATQTNIPAVQVSQQPATSQRLSGELEGHSQRRRWHWLVFVGMALLTMTLGWVVLTNLANWWQVTQDDWHYGRPRTYQVDAVVEHNDSATNPTHFIALNQARHVEVIEFPGGDPSKARIFIGPTLTGQGQDLTPVTLTFKDVNGDGKPDMILNIQDTRFVFINENGTFRPARPGENVQI